MIALENISITGFVLDRKAKTPASTNGTKKAIEITFYKKAISDSDDKPHAATVKLAGQYFENVGVRSLGELFSDYFGGKYFTTGDLFDLKSANNLPDKFHKVYIITREKAREKFENSIEVPESELTAIKRENEDLKKQVEYLRISLNNRPDERDKQQAASAARAESVATVIEAATIPAPTPKGKKSNG